MYRGVRTRKLSWPVTTFYFRLFPFPFRQLHLCYTNKGVFVLYCSSLVTIILFLASLVLAPLSPLVTEINYKPTVMQGNVKQNEFEKLLTTWKWWPDGYNICAMIVAVVCQLALFIWVIVERWALSSEHWQRPPTWNLRLLKHHILGSKLRSLFSVNIMWSTKTWACLHLLIQVAFTLFCIQCHSSSKSGRGE